MRRVSSGGLGDSVVGSTGKRFRGDLIRFGL